MTTPQEQTLRSYVESFNRHDIEAVMAHFVDDPTILDMSGTRHEGLEQVRKFYEVQFALFPDGRCDINAVIGHGTTGMAETAFRGTHAKSGRIVSACGPEVVEFAGDKIKELRDYHRLTS